jgi:hypothetical protein
LERIADIADARDRLAAQLVVAVADIDGLHPELFADLSPQVWLEQTCRMTSTEARTLLATADTLTHLPTVIAGLRDGRLSWSQTRELAAAARTVPVARRTELDDLIATLLDEYRRLRAGRADRPDLAHRGNLAARPAPQGRSRRRT